MWHALFDNLSTIVDYLIPKPTERKDNNGAIQPIARGVDKIVQTYSKGFYPKVNVLELLQFEQLTTKSKSSTLTTTLQ